MLALSRQAQEFLVCLHLASAGISDAFVSVVQ